MATDNIENYTQYTEFQDSDRVKIYSKKNKLAPVSLSLGDLKNQIVTDALGAIGYSVPTYVEVDIDASDIATLGTNPIELVPAQGANKYIKLQMLILELTALTPHIVNSGDLFYIVQDSGTISANCEVMLGATENNVLMFNCFTAGEVGGANWLNQYPTTLNKNLLLSIDNNPSIVGTSTIKAKIWYSIETFGTNL